MSVLTKLFLLSIIGKKIFTILPQNFLFEFIYKTCAYPKIKINTNIEHKVVNLLLSGIEISVLGAQKMSH